MVQPRNVKRIIFYVLATDFSLSFPLTRSFIFVVSLFARSHAKSLVKTGKSFLCDFRPFVLFAFLAGRRHTNTNKQRHQNRNTHSHLANNTKGNYLLIGFVCCRTMRKVYFVILMVFSSLFLPLTLSLCFSCPLCFTSSHFACMTEQRKSSFLIMYEFHTDDPVYFLPFFCLSI